jgi:hypothetical protein
MFAHLIGSRRKPGLAGALVPIEVGRGGGSEASGGGSLRRATVIRKLWSSSRLKPELAGALLSIEVARCGASEANGRGYLRGATVVGNLRSSSRRQRRAPVRWIAHAMHSTIQSGIKIGAMKHAASSKKGTAQDSDSRCVIWLCGNGRQLQPPLGRLMSIPFWRALSGLGPRVAIELLLNTAVCNSTGGTAGSGCSLERRRNSDVLRLEDTVRYGRAMFQ